MKITFLGTSSGSPTKYRNVSATAISFEKSKSWILVDCGEGTQHQILKSSLSAYHLDTIFISHLHGDHCYGLPGLIASMAMTGKKTALTIVAPSVVIQFVINTLSLTEVKLPFDIHYQSIEQVSDPLTFNDFIVEIIALKHRAPSFGFKIKEACIPNKLKIDKLKADGVTSGPHFNVLQKGNDVEFEGKHLSAEHYAYPSWKPRIALICGDNERPSVMKEYIEGIDILVHEATFTTSDLHKVGMHTGHSDAKRIAEFSQKCEVPNLALFHFSTRYHGPGMLRPLVEEAERFYQGNLIIAEDFMEFDIPKTPNA